MRQVDPHMQIARKVRTVELTKIELVQQVADILRKLQSGHESELEESLGMLVGTAYFLGRQLGLNLNHVDHESQTKFPSALLQDATDHTDLEVVHRHLGSTR